MDCRLLMVPRLGLDESGKGLLIKEEVEFVAKEVEKKVEKLRSAPEVHVGKKSFRLSLISSHGSLSGLEIIHLFVLDLLGRFGSLPSSPVQFDSPSQRYAGCEDLCSQIRRGVPPRHGGDEIREGPRLDLHHFGEPLLRFLFNAPGIAARNRLAGASDGRSLSLPPPHLTSLSEKVFGRLSAPIPSRSSLLCHH